MSKVLVTGAAGFLGSWVAERLLAEGRAVVGVDDLSGGEADNVPDGCQFAVGSILDLPRLTKLTHGCDVVVHCAALPYEGLSVFSPATVVNNIVTGTVNVAVAAVRSGARRVVNCSSMARYGLAPVPYREDFVPIPVDPYGHAKLAAERQLDLLGAVHGFEVVHAVPHNIYGPRQRYDDPYRNVAAIMINLATSGRAPVVYGDGRQTRCFSYVTDVLPTLVTLLDCPAAHGEVFNVGPDRGAVTIGELAEMVRTLVKDSIPPTVYVQDRPCEVKHAVCSSDKIRSRFGYESRVELREGLQELVEYVRRKGPRPFRYNLPLEIVNDKTPRTWVDRLF